MPETSHMELNRMNDQNIIIRPATVADIDRIMTILSEAADFMHSNGNPTQWANGYPGRDRVEDDIRSGWSYVAENRKGVIVATFALIPSPEPTYLHIFNGQWLSDTSYHVIHRMACTERRTGMATACLLWCMTQDTHLRADTHRDNIPMRSLLVRNGFTECGTIYQDDGSERIAFEINK